MTDREDDPEFEMVTSIKNLRKTRQNKGLYSGRDHIQSNKKSL